MTTFLTKHPFVSFPVGFVILSVIATVVATLRVIAESGYGHASAFCNFAVYFAFWPSLLVGFPEDGLFLSLAVFLVNCVGWLLVGICIAALFRLLYAKEKC